MTFESLIKKCQREKEIELKKAGYKSLGYANGWTHENPNEYDDHRCLEHETKSIQNSYTCDHLYWCDQCKIYWKEDSGD